MAVIMVAGNQAVLPDSLTSGVRTMTTNIVMEMGYSSGLHREALIAVSYTHLTLPTTDSVEVSAVVVSLKKNTDKCSQLGTVV